MEKVRIQDDLYNHVNQEWIDNAVIPDDRPTCGGFANLDIDVEKLLMNDFDEFAKSGNNDKSLDNAVKMYKAVKDVKRRNREGFKPVLKVAKVFDKITDLKSLNRKLKDLMYINAPLPFEFHVDADMKDTKHHRINFKGASTILPDTTYYLEPMAQQKAMMIGLWSQMTKAVLLKAGLDEKMADTYLADTLKFDELIAKFAKSAEEWSDYPATYNPMKGSRVCSLVKPLKLKKLLLDFFGEVPEIVIVNEPRYFKNFKEIFNEENVMIFKHWSYVKFLLHSCTYLSEELRALGTTYQRALVGVNAVASVEKHAYHLVSSYYSEPVGLYYGKKYFGEEAKKDVVDMVKEIVETYKGRINRNDFLDVETKEKAILKLSTMKIKMGYPDKINPIFDSLVYDEKLPLFVNVTNLYRIIGLDNFAKLHKDVDRSEWVMPGHMVNACYNPFTNDITFPAAILQPPFYSIKQTRSQNLGGIGAVIGHEISHAFDNNGAKCDENGNLVNWWKKSDFKQFNNRTKAMIKEFEGIELPWGKVNAKFIVSENIADNGGMGVTLEIMSKMKDKNYEEYFINWAKVWCMKAKPEYLQLLINVDVHAPAILRANMQPRNFNEWYETFNVKKTDKMYIAPNKRVIIW